MRTGSIKSTGGAFIKSASGVHQDGKWKGSYGYSIAIEHGLKSVSIQPDGKILCGGKYTAHLKRKDMLQKSVSGISRLLIDGELDITFNLECNLMNGATIGTCNSVAVLSTGEVVCGGIFTTACGVSASNIVRLDGNGFYDSSFVTGTGFNGAVNKILKQIDDKIVCVGDFTTYNGIACNYIVRLNTDGSIDSGFHTGTNFTTRILNAYLFSTGSIMCIGGGYLGSVRTLILLTPDGYKNTYFNYVPKSDGLGGTALPYSIVLDHLNRYVVGESYAVLIHPLIHYYGILRRLNSDGTYSGVQSASLVNIPISGSGLAIPYSLYLTESDEILCGGIFNRCASRHIFGLALFNSNLQLQTLDFKMIDMNLKDFLGVVYDMSEQSTTSRKTKKVIIGGMFRGAGISGTEYVSRHHILRLNSDLTVDKYPGETA